MKKIVKYIILFISIALLFSSCSLSERVKNKLDSTEPIATGNERGYIIYNGKTYYDLLSDDRCLYYKDFWIPLTDASIKQKAIYSLDTGVCDTTIKTFEDKSLNMFIVSEDFWGEWLYCDQKANLPNYLTDNVEKIYLGSENAYYTDKNCIIIDVEKDVSSIMADLRKVSSYESNEDNSTNDYIPYGIGLKFKNMGAIYDLVNWK